jgi:hypothetical protein
MSVIKSWESACKGWASLKKVCKGRTPNSFVCSVSDEAESFMTRDTWLDNSLTVGRRSSFGLTSVWRTKWLWRDFQLGLETSSIEGIKKNLVWKKNSQARRLHHSPEDSIYPRYKWMCFAYISHCFWEEQNTLAFNLPSSVMFTKDASPLV